MTIIQEGNPRKIDNHYHMKHHEEINKQFTALYDVVRHLDDRIIDLTKKVLELESRTPIAK